MLKRDMFFRLRKRLGLLKLKPVVFLHLQKTAGTSITNVAKQYYGTHNVISHGDFFLGKNRNQVFDDKSFKPRRDKLEDIPFISGHFGYDFAKQFMADRYSFTFLRDPVERVLSLYFFCKTRDPKQFKVYDLAQRLSLDEYLALGFTDPDIKAHIWNHQVSQLAAGWDATNNMMLTDDALLELAMQHLETFSYVGFTETFDRDQINILNAIGIKIQVDSLKSNANPGRPVFDNLGGDTKNLLLELTKLDRLLYEKAWAKKSINV